MMPAEACDRRWGSLQGPSGLWTQETTDAGTSVTGLGRVRRAHKERARSEQPQTPWDSPGGPPREDGSPPTVRSQPPSLAIALCTLGACSPVTPKQLFLSKGCLLFLEDKSHLSCSLPRPPSSPFQHRGHSDASPRPPAHSRCSKLKGSARDGAGVCKSCPTPERGGWSQAPCSISLCDGGWLGRGPWAWGPGPMGAWEEPSSLGCWSGVVCAPESAC